MKYEAPIELVMGQLKTQVDGEIFKAIQEVNVKVDKDELIKALQYDRAQYEKGYKDGVKEFADKLKAEAYTECDITGYKYQVLQIEEIDNLLAEMGCNDD